MKKIKKILFELLKIIITLTLLFFLFRKLNFAEVIRTLKGIKIYFFVLGVFMYGFGIFLSSVRWNIFLRHLGFKYSSFSLFIHYLKALFFANFLPSGGLDVARLMFLGKDRIKEKLSSTFMDRVFGFLAINIYVVFGLLYSIKDTRRYAYLVIGALFLQFLFFFMLFSKKTAFFFKVLKALPLGEHLYHIYEILHSFREKGLIKRALVLSFFIQLSYSIDTFFIGLSVGGNMGVLRTVLFVPFINFISMIPVTISGFGLREGGFVFLFQHYIGKETAIVVSLLYYLTTFALSIFGGLLLIRIKRK